MGLWDQVQHFFAVGAMQERTTIFESNELPIDEQIAEIRRRRSHEQRPWHKPTLAQALGVPAIFRCVALISNTAGAMTLKALRNGVLLPEDERPRVIVRPDPFSTPRAFFRDTVYSMATRGEAWWWVAKRDSDGGALSLVVVPPNEIEVEETSNRARPKITWNVKGGPRVMANEDMRQITYLREPGELRGFGPLQICGAAVSVAYEAQEWAANFYAGGGHPSVWIKAAGMLGETDSEDEDGDPEHEADIIRRQWMDKPNNVPRVTDDSIEDIRAFNVNPQGAQMLDARDHQVGESVRMFGVPASLLNYATPGSSLTYQNVGQEFDKFIRTVLWPDYLEAIEQEMSDLLTRSTVARFNIDAFTRADIKTRWDVYSTAVDVVGQEQAAAWARREEGFEPGDIENAPIPFAPPAAVPSFVPVAEERSTFGPLRCPRCARLIVEVAPPGTRGTCPRCKQAAAA